MSHGKAAMPRIRLLRRRKTAHQFLSTLLVRQAVSSQGFSIQLALLVFLVVILGTVALASRTSSGLFGSANQSINREARDAAESGITQLIDELNKEQNRNLLVAGNSNAWSSGMTNECTRYNSVGDVTLNTPASPTSRALGFAPKGSVEQWTNLDGETARKFRVEKVQYLSESRAFYNNPATEMLTGQERSLLRVTVVGQVSRNGRTSQARVSREFEVVPKCCKRSFGRNTYGTKNWGNHSEICFREPGGGGNGIITALNGGGTEKSSGNTLQIKDENGDLITQAICYGGALESAEIGDLSGSIQPKCNSNELSIGKSVSLVPQQFFLDLPDYCTTSSPPCSSTWPSLSYSGPQYIFIDTSVSPGVVKVASGLSGGIASGTATNLSGCYEAQAPSGGNPGVYNCRLRSIRVSGSNTLIVDTTGGKINFFFDEPAAASKYIDLEGAATIKRVQCSGLAWSTASYSTSRCAMPLTWSDYQEGSGGGITSLPFANSELLNIYATGAGSIDLRGTSDAVGVNVMAPKATVELYGGGSADPNFMGRIWVDDLSLKGNVKVNVLSSNPSICDLPGECPPIIGLIFDHVARSFSHASGF